MRRWFAATARRVQEPRNRFARWTARWFDPVPAVPADRFQDDGEPYPRHWRDGPAPWTTEPTDAQVQAAVDDLPGTWREVLVARDVLGQDADEVGRRLGLTEREQRDILNRARAKVREALA